MDLSDNITKVILALITIITVTGFAIKIYKKSSQNNNNLKNINAGGDVVGGDKKTKVKNVRKKRK